ncbi:uncharacterized protein LOC105703968 [Orussus abietinus]|uniref:uncharacterized protein LOC105703968 n=1 Tax=Orussus abietinus TaxID=222816 RepID=UPI0006260649|nr:uncharacterized protein LOC105703968 [Orussus abietinus]
MVQISISCPIPLIDVNAKRRRRKKPWSCMSDEKHGDGYVEDVARHGTPEKLDFVLLNWAQIRDLDQKIMEMTTSRMPILEHLKHEIFYHLNGYLQIGLNMDPYKIT